MADEGFVIAPKDLNGVRMSIGEIAALLGIYSQTAKRHIRAVERVGIAQGDYTMTCIADGHGVHPEFYGLEMLAAVAFRVRSWQADVFRRWLMERATQPSHRTTPPIAVIWPVKENRLPN